MQRLFIILAMVGIVTACGRSTPAAQAPQVVEVTKVATVEVTSVVTRVVVITATSQPTVEATATVQPTVEATATVQPTVEATATVQSTVEATTVPLPASAVPSVPTANSSTASVVNGGNLRSETTVSAHTVIGQVCPGDQVTVLAQQSVGTAVWYKVQIITTVSDCHATHVAIGTEGWLSSSLISQPSSAVASLPPAVPVSDPPPANPNTPPQTGTAPSFKEIRSQMQAMTDAQWNLYRTGLEGKQVTRWKGWVSEVKQKFFGGYEVLIDMDAPDTMSVYDITFSVPDNLAVQLQKDQIVTFSGTIKTASKGVFDTLSLSLDFANIQ